MQAPPRAVVEGAGEDTEHGVDEGPYGKLPTHAIRPLGATLARECIAALIQDRWRPCVKEVEPPLVPSANAIFIGSAT